MAKAWGGRFQQETDLRVEAFTESISFDRRLYEVDVRGSQAHARMLAHAGLIRSDECTQICDGLDQIRSEIEAGEFEFRVDLEDIHMHIENALISRIGDVGRKLHTGRSRNDQVSTDLRLYVRDSIDEVDALLLQCQQAFLERCEQDENVILPGYTHLQRAQPVLAAHYWLAYCEKFQRDRERLRDCRGRVNISPLGAAALAGSSLPLDRNFTAKELNFDGVAANSLDISSDRDYLIEFVFTLSLIATHLSAWCEEWIIWFTTEFSFITFPDSYTTGSSIMPQKRNPDVLELIRGKTARVIAAVPQLLILLKSLPMAYNRDLQEDKVALFDALDTVKSCLELTPSIVVGAELQRDNIESRLEDGFLDATALMEYLIRQGVPMRTGHTTVGKLVTVCESRGCRLAELSLSELQSACDLIQEDVYSVLGTKNAMQALISFGSGGESSVADRVKWWQQKIGV
ncbi:MAG: argininosuccinate lyase [Fuerstiella sp.]|nr:argininosuccinate lyase [Fuerstiella sp.]